MAMEMRLAFQLFVVLAITIAASAVEKLNEFDSTISNLYLRRKRRAVADITNHAQQKATTTTERQQNEDEYGRELGDKAMILLEDSVLSEIAFLTASSMSISINSVTTTTSPTPSSGAFNLANCGSYASQWLSDLADTCVQISNFPDGCHCSDAEAKVNNGEIVCDETMTGYVPCPNNCEVCHLCLDLVCP